jgi:3-hydroxyacyl-[acyl-carrier-protein] dehydratase
MPPPAFADLSKFDLDHLEYGPEEVRKRNPHRFEMELLSGVVAYRPDEDLIIGVVETSPDDFWVRGHIPGRPLFPGVLMVEASAQLCSFYWRSVFTDHEKFFGFAGIEDTRFRGTVNPGDRLILVGKSIDVRPRRAIFDTQGYIGDEMVFETRVKGMPF